MASSTPTTSPQDLPTADGIQAELLTCKEAAQLAGVGERTWWSWTRSGLAPKPIFIGHGTRPACRYRRSEIMSWIQDGCPRGHGGQPAMTHATERNGWQEVTAAEPCPICEKPDWCRRSPDGTKIACRREARGAVKTKRYKDGSEAYIHDLQPDRPQDGNGKPKRQRQPSGLTPTAADAPILQDSPTPSGTAKTRWPNATRGIVVCWPSCLSPDHRDNLRQRGLSDADVDAGGYRTLPTNGRGAVVKKLAVELGQDFAAVPGFVMSDGRPRIAAPAGLLIPVRDRWGESWR